MVLDSSDGWPAENVFEGAQSGISFDDFVLLPGHVSFDASDVDMSCHLTSRVRLNLPLVSSPADTVTEYEQAIGLALVGGIGFIHCNQGIKSQAEMLKRAKRFVSGFILEPVTLRPDNTLRDVDRIWDERGISSICITENGHLGSKLVGLVTSRDTEIVQDRDTKISEVMVKRVIRGLEPLTMEEALDQLKQSKVGKLPIVNSDGRLTTMVTRSDIKKVRDFPRMSRDVHGQLLAGARVVAGGWNDSGPQPPGSAYDRASSLAEAGADIICLDPSDASSDGQLKLIAALKEAYPNVDILAGPVLSCREAKRLVEAGVDGLIVGGSQDVEGPGRAEGTALFEVAKYVLQNYGDSCKIIAGAGSMKNSGHVLKALSLGASAVMLKEAFAATDEAPGRFVLDKEQNLHESSVKKLHDASAGALPAMGHIVAKGGEIVGSRSRQPKSVLPRGLGEPVHSHGSIRQLATYIVQGVRHGMRDLGLKSIAALHAALHSGDLRFEVLTSNASRLQEARKRASQAAPHPEVVMPMLIPPSCSGSF